MKRLSFDVLPIVLAGTKASRELFQPILMCRGEEVMLAALLDRQGVVIEMLGTMGDREKVEVEPSRLLRRALKSKAEGIILAHNHPSGDASPSHTDKVWTRAFALQCEALSITLVDHMVFAGRKFFSFRQHGLM